MRIPTEYTAFQTGPAKKNGCLYLTPPHGYHRYAYRGFRGPHQFDTVARSEQFPQVGEIVCVAKADYSGGETIVVSVTVIDALGVNGSGGGGAGQFSTLTFEYDITGGGVTPGNIQIDISGDTTAEEVRDATYLAIAGALGGPVCIDRRTTDEVLIYAKGPKVLLSLTGNSLPLGATALVKPNSYDDQMQAGPRSGQISYYYPPGGPPGWTRGEVALWLPFNVT